MASREDDPMIAEIAFGQRRLRLSGEAAEPQSTPDRRRERALPPTTGTAERATSAQRLEQAVQERACELRAAIEGMRVSEEETVHRLSRAVEMRDVPSPRPDRADRRHRGASWLPSRPDPGAGRAAAHRSPDARRREDRDRGSDPAQAGPDLTDQERREMKRHTEIGYELLSSSNSELLSMAAVIALTHHERFDGAGLSPGTGRRGNSARGQDRGRRRRLRCSDQRPRLQTRIPAA